MYKLLHFVFSLFYTMVHNLSLKTTPFRNIIAFYSIIEYTEKCIHIGLEFHKKNWNSFIPVYFTITSLISLSTIEYVPSGCFIFSR